MFNDDTLRENLLRLRGQVHDEETLIGLLSLPLELLGFVTSTVDQSEGLDKRKIKKYIRDYQSCLVRDVLPHWVERLAEMNKISLVKTYFIPIPKTDASKEALISSYDSLIAPPILQFSVDTLCELCDVFTPLDAFEHLFAGNTPEGIQEAAQTWTDFNKSLFSIPGRLMNASVEEKLDIPDRLLSNQFFSGLCLSFHQLLQSSHVQSDKGVHVEAAASTLSRLVTFGCFPLSMPILPTATSFWKQVLQILINQPKSIILDRNSGQQHILISILACIPLGQQIAIIQSLFAHLDIITYKNLSISIAGVDDSPTHRLAIKQTALQLSNIVGWPMQLKSDSSITNTRAPWDSTLWSLTSTILDRPISQGLARAISCWFSLGPSRDKALRKLLDRAVELWTDEEHIKHSTLDRHRVVTCLLLTTLVELFGNLQQPQTENSVFRYLSTLPSFVNAVGIYIGHLDPSVRRCGLLVAEIIAQNAGGKLQFQDWDGDGEGREWARAMRSLANGRDSDAEVEKGDATPSLSQENYQSALSPPLPTNSQTITIVDQTEDSDDSLEGYASSELSSRPPTPTPAVETLVTEDPKLESREPTVEEVNADPTLLDPMKKKIRRPVYLLDLGNLFKVPKEGSEQAESIRVGLENASALIRRKARWGSELEENAVDLAYTIMGLQNNYDLENFDLSVLEALTALVACCPKKAAPCIIEHFFTPSFSVGQRFRMLSALALGARELAGLPTPQLAVRVLEFPSRLLAPPSHKKYITSEDMEQADVQIRGLVEGISAEAVEKGRKNAEESVPEIVRERQLTILGGRNKKPGIVELNSSSRPSQEANVKASVSFTELASEFFISPLISRFWVYLQDSLAYEDARRRTRSGGGFRAAGTGMILSPLVLAHLVNTVAVLAHAARHSPAYLSIIAPAALELAATVGTRKMSTEQSFASGDSSDEELRRDSSVLCSALELAIVVVDACIDLDGGKTIASENGSLVTSASIWANKTFETVHKGLRLEGMGGEMERRLSKASAGLVIKLEEVTARWHPIPLLPM